MPDHLTDSAFLKDQYHNGSNLSARAGLHERFSTATREFPRRVFEYFDFSTNARVLEIGCGTGLLWTKNRERIPAAWRLTLSDFSRGMVETARAAGIAADFLQSDAQHIPFPSANFEAVIANHMLYHVADLPRALAEIRRLLKPGGKLYAATNGVDHMRELDGLLAECGIKPQAWVLGFSLDNGAECLAKEFVDVQRVDFEDSLAVTEVEPLVAYVKSGKTRQLISAEGETRLCEIISERIARDGAFRITKSPGLFIARAS